MLNQIPAWVFFVFAALLYLGMIQSRTRVVTLRRIALPAAAMTALSLYGVIGSFGAAAGPLLAWAAAFGLVLLAGGPVFGARVLGRTRHGVEIAGSWLPLGLMMAIFAGKFALGMATALAPAAVRDPLVAAGASALFGLLSGAFGVRALSVLRAADAPQGEALVQRMEPVRS